MMTGWWLLIAAVVVLIARGFGRQSSATSTGGAEQVLGERYAAVAWASTGRPGRLHGARPDDGRTE